MRRKTFFSETIDANTYYNLEVGILMDNRYLGIILIKVNGICFVVLTKYRLILELFFVAYTLLLDKLSVSIGTYYFYETYLPILKFFFVENAKLEQLNNGIIIIIFIYFKFIKF